MSLFPVFSSLSPASCAGPLLTALSVYLIGFAIYNRYFHPYKDFPGPFWASITTLWYFYSVRYAKSDNYMLPIHQKYGPFVRIAPNQVQIADPAAIKTIYGPKPTFNKAYWYSCFESKISKRSDGFCERDEVAHMSRRRILAPLYTQGSVLECEPCVDRLIRLFHDRMEQFSTEEAVFDMSVWLRKYTFDVIGEIFYGREGGFGFMRDDIDYNGWCHLMDVMAPPIAAITHVPYGFRSLYLATQLLSSQARAGLRGSITVKEQSHAAVNQRLEERASQKGGSRSDILSKLLDIVEKDGERLDFGTADVVTEIWAIIWAGSDTTAIALTAIFYYLHTHPRALAKLRDEIDCAFDEGALRYPIRLNDAIKLPYLNAVVWEAMRIHPSLGFGLPRVVPEGGAEICGRFFAGGYEVIVNQNAVHFDKTVFGEDSESFVPERWLRDGDRGRANMERHMLHFGYGTRVCIGKHITWTEMFKLLPTILRDFEFELHGEWHVYKGWFHQQKNVNVTVKRRVSLAPAS